MSDKYDSAILLLLGLMFVCVALFGNRDIWRRSRRTSVPRTTKSGAATDWPLALAALTIILFCCAVALRV
jgi:hypothetical protein